MPITKLIHYSIRTPRLEASIRFYADVLGLSEGYRPGFRFPGAWMYRGGDEAEFGVVHLLGTDEQDALELTEYLGNKDAGDGRDNSVIDHLAFLATDLPDMLRRLRANSIACRERTVPDLQLHQVFFEDPTGVTIELNFAAAEAAAMESNAAPTS
jgi:catechol 2,3-dioxygenase-like lactoylglutathione lyase family enzyme